MSGIKVGVVIQRMIDADSAGGAFSRNAVDPNDREHLLFSSVWGQGEGLVSGLLPADEFKVHRRSFDFKEEVVTKMKALRSAPQGGLQEVPIAAEFVNKPSLS